MEVLVIVLMLEECRYSITIKEPEATYYAEATSMNCIKIDPIIGMHSWDEAGKISMTYFGGPAFSILK